MKVAILGAGYAGLAAAYYLLEMGAEVTVYDPHPEKSASFASTGILNPLLGRFPKRDPLTDLYMKETNHLFAAAGKYGEFIINRGVFRPALFPSQEKHFRRLAKKHADAVFLEENKVPGMVPFPGLFLKEGLTIDSPAYLNALKTCCKEKGALFEKPQNFDVILKTVGASLQGYPLEIIKGQMLICRWPENLPEIPFTICGMGHISCFSGKALIGSTYEREFLHENADENAHLLLEKVSRFFPPAKVFEILEKRSALRVHPQKGTRPLLIQESENTWVFGGLGSRGLLCHAYYAKELSERILSKKNL